MILCERCFAILQPNAEFCPECGAPVSKAPAAEGSDAIIYPELARANLLRMRAEYKHAETQCLSILRRYPNNVSAHILLGDICAENDDIDQAMQWYELALELAPDSQPTKKKLQAVKERMQKKETAATAEQIGLPQTASHSGRITTMLVGAIVVVGAIAYVAGAGIQRKSDQSTGVQKTVVEAPAQKSAVDTKTAVPDIKSGEQPKENPTPAQTPVGPDAQEDRALAQQIAKRAPAGEPVPVVSRDPRSNLITVTFSLGAADDPKEHAAQFARAAFDEVPAAKIVTLRATKDGVLIYVADSHREAYEEIGTPGWKSQNEKDPNAWIAHILVDEWNAPPATSTTTPAP